MERKRKIIIYSLLPRLWGNRTESPKPNGTIEENGVGKLSDITIEDLKYIKSLGATHIWLIGLLDHATATSFPGVDPDPQEIVKGIAGSPYAVRDYYNIAPELIGDNEDAFVVFEDLLQRIHSLGLKILIDFIPNHVARTYKSNTSPSDVVDLGAEDDRSVAFSNQNNFYYFPESALRMPVAGAYQEFPARATGNDCFSPSPSETDWYETIKLNYGIDYLGGKEVYDPIPNTWLKMRYILLYWVSKGVDGFRCDMAELVPEAFWTWVIPQIKEVAPDQLFLAEIYQPHRYEAYLKSGFDYLYDKVGMYDTARAVIGGYCDARCLDKAREANPIQERMCYFLENHDEQRIASDFFAHKPERAIPALATLLLSGTNPFLLYFGQEIGERGMDAEGFSGIDGRTTIFDYWALPSIQRLRANKLQTEEQALLAVYQKLLGEVASNSLIGAGGYYGLNYANKGKDSFAPSTFAFLRYDTTGILLVVANYSGISLRQQIRIPQECFEYIDLAPNTPLRTKDLLTGAEGISVLTPLASVSVELDAYGIALLQYQII